MPCRAVPCQQARLNQPPCQHGTARHGTARHDNVNVCRNVCTNYSIPRNNSCRQVIDNLVHGPVHSYLPNFGKDHTLLGLGEVSVQTTARRIATCCSFLLDNLLFSNVIRFLDTAIFLLEDFISCWLDWQRDLAAKQSANLSISYTRTERRRVKG